MNGDQCAGGQRSKERLTVALCASVTGEKCVPLVIGKCKKPRLHMTCIWQPPLHGGHFCQVPRVTAIDRFDYIYINIYI